VVWGGGGGGGGAKEIIRGWEIVAINWFVTNSYKPI
jgi:hypothetical protein